MSGFCTSLEHGFIEAFRDFLAVDLRLSELTVKGHVIMLKRFAKWLKENGVSEVTQDVLPSYLKTYSGKSSSSYANVVKSLKRLFRDYLKRPELVETFRLPKHSFKPKASAK